MDVMDVMDVNHNMKQNHNCNGENISLIFLVTTSPLPSLSARSDLTADWRPDVIISPPWYLSHTPTLQSHPGNHQSPHTG